MSDRPIGATIRNDGRARELAENKYVAEESIYSALMQTRFVAASASAGASANTDTETPGRAPASTSAQTPELTERQQKSLDTYLAREAMNDVVEAVACLCEESRAAKSFCALVRNVMCDRSNAGRADITPTPAELGYASVADIYAGFGIPPPAPEREGQPPPPV